MHSTRSSVTRAGMAGTATMNVSHVLRCVEKWIAGKLLLIGFIWSFTLSSWLAPIRKGLPQESSFSIKTPLGLSVATKRRVVGLAHITKLKVYAAPPLLAINGWNSFSFKASREDLVESLEAAIAKQAQRIKRLVFIVRLLEAWWPQLNNWRVFYTVLKLLVISILRKTKRHMSFWF